VGATASGRVAVVETVALVGTVAFETRALVETAAFVRILLSSLY